MCLSHGDTDMLLYHSHYAIYITTWFWKSFCLHLEDSPENGLEGACTTQISLGILYQAFVFIVLI